jgi:voltage-gated potassium channel Kch
VSSETSEAGVEPEVEEYVDPTEERLDNPGYEIFIAILSILSIVNLIAIYLVDDQAIEYVLTTMNALLSFILFLDFLQRFIKAPKRGVSPWHYFFREFGWADLLASVPVPQLKILRIFRLLKAYRLFKRYGAKHLAKTLLEDRAGSALWLLLLIATFVLQFGSVWMLRIEQYSPGANITSASDAIWYTLVTISTVGYGDQYPVTNAGRFLGTGIIVLGVGIFGTLTGYLANAFIAPKKKTAEEEAEDDAARAAEEGRDAELHERVDQLHKLLGEQQEAIARLEELLRSR